MYLPPCPMRRNSARRISGRGVTITCFGRESCPVCTPRARSVAIVMYRSSSSPRGATRGWEATKPVSVVSADTCGCVFRVSRAVTGVFLRVARAFNRCIFFEESRVCFLMRGLVLAEGRDTRVESFLSASSALTPAYTKTHPLTAHDTQKHARDCHIKTQTRDFSRTGSGGWPRSLTASSALTPEDTVMGITSSHGCVFVVSRAVEVVVSCVTGSQEVCFIACHGQSRVCFRV